MDGSAFAPISFFPAMSGLGPSELFYLFVVAATVLISFAFLRHPFVNLSVTIFFLASANVYILGSAPSAAIAALLIGNCLLGIVLVSGFRLPVERSSLWVPLLLGAIAALGAVYGIAHGNRASSILGDFYQIIELALLFVLTRMLVKTEQQLSIMVNVLIGSIIATSVLQLADVWTGASYLSISHHIARPEEPDLLRSINMNAPVAFVVLLAALAVARTRWWLLAGLALVEINLIMSFTRGLWAATIASAIFLLMAMRKSRISILKFGFAAAVFAIAFSYIFGLGSVVADRIGFTFRQFNTPQEKQALSNRRRLEYSLILPKVLERPIMGAGLGATYRISGDAILRAPKGEMIEHHYIHDLYLQVAFRLGIPALLILLVLLWTYFRRSIANLRISNLSPENSALMAGLVAAMFGEVLLSLTSPTLLNHPTAGVIGCIMALTTAALRKDAQEATCVDIGCALNKI
jgi:O-Antigen ligase